MKDRTPHFHGELGQSPLDVIGSAELGPVTYALRRGLGATIRAAEETDPRQAYEAIAARERFAPGRAPTASMHAVVARELQRLWYLLGDGEPPRVAQRREALYASMRIALDGGGGTVYATAAPQKRKRRRRTDGLLIRKGLREGQTTKEILEAVKARNPDAATTAASIASIRWRMQKSGELAKKGDG